ncbi:MAG TPA: hypothetical protein VLT35_05305, partial [Methanocella sp.]|nr:hypothetical protein [Methanocella sp.]
MKGAATPSDFQVKCANCGAFFLLNKVRTYDNGYYCRACYHELQRQQQVQSKSEVTCATCGRILTAYDTQVQDAGKTCCPACHEKSHGRGGPGKAAADDAQCGDCGKPLAPDGPRVQYYDQTYCIDCYDRAYPNLKIKTITPQFGDTLAALRPGRRVLCASCHGDLGPLDVRVHEGGAVYCDRCYEKVRKARGPDINEATRRSEFVPHHSATVLRVPDKLIECAHCGRVYTRDGLAADERGRYRCPVCG